MSQIRFQDREFPTIEQHYTYRVLVDWMQNHRHVRHDQRFVDRMSQWRAFVDFREQLAMDLFTEHDICMSHLDYEPCETCWFNFMFPLSSRKPADVS